MLDPMTLAIIFATFLIAGTVKGVLGLGLPTVSLALLTLAFDLPHAMALLLVPSFVTNLWQALTGGHTRIIAKRLWPFLALAALLVWPGTLALTHVDLDLLTALLGAVLVVYAALSLAGFAVDISPASTRWAGPLLGAVNGLLTGMTGSFVVPGVLYLQSIKLPRDVMIQAMGMLFTVSTVALALAMGGQNLLSTDQGLMSASGVLPAVIGMMVGQNIRSMLAEATFRRVFFIALLALGGYIMVHTMI